VWAYTHPDHLLKYECPALGADVEDVAWDAESKRILAVGGGQTKAKVFQWDTGSNLAEVVPHNKKAITGDLRPARPFRMATGAEDFNVQFYAGPPFKYSCGLKEHSNFVNCLRYAPDGSRFVSVSSDKTGVVYNGETGEVVGKLDPTGGHAGSIFHCAWSPDSKLLATSGGDKTVRVWDMSAASGPYKCVASATLGTRPEDMQQSVTWPSQGVVVSTSLDGTLNVFNAADVGAGPVRRITGHQQPTVCMDLDRATGLIYTACMAGRTCVWRPVDEARTTYEATLATGEVATKKAAAIAVAGKEVAVAAWDDKLRIGDAVTGVLTATVPLGGQPKGLAVSPAAPDVRIVPTGSAVLVIKGSAVAATVAAAWGPTCVDISADGSIVAVGGADKKVHVYRLSGSSLVEEGETKEAGAAISCVAISPDGATVAAGDALREVRLYTVATRETLVSGRWMNHTTRVTGLKWSPSGAVIASVSTDRRLCVWDPKADQARLSIDLANPHPFVACAWASETDLWTLGSDGVASLRKLTL
jgi:WD repeat-containing protein 1 (actin-interacting protein 1)